MKFYFILLFTLIWLQEAPALVRGFNVTETEGFLFDANKVGDPKTPAQLAVDQAQRLGANHIVLNVSGRMVGPFSNEVLVVTAPAERSNEARRIISLVSYIHSLGLTAGLRPIFFVVGPGGEFPYVDENQKTWWHGNIQPENPNRWFESFRTFLDYYANVAKIAKTDEFTLGAELYSMTVGIEDQWLAFPYGFPGRWLELLRFIRKKLPKMRLMYDINFTDDRLTDSSGTPRSGGEMERWRYRISDLAEPQKPADREIWQDLVNFWKELDAIGIDMYRSLATQNAVIPSSYNELLKLLSLPSESYATQLDTALLEIENWTQQINKPVILKEIGFRSVHKTFIDPFTYATSQGELNIMHQAASYQAIFKGFWEPKWPWFEGIDFWEIPINPALSGAFDKGFSPVNKSQTENIIMDHYKHPYK